MRKFVFALAFLVAYGATADCVMSLTNAQVRLLGPIGCKLDAVLRERFKSEYAQTVVYNEAENAFRTHYDDRDAPLFGWWQGEYWGKTMLSATAMYALTRDADLRQFILSKAHAFLAEYQREDGYVGTYRDPCFLKSQHEQVCNQWCWNIWCRKYTTWALYDIYVRTGDRVCLDAAVRSTDQMLAMMRDQKVRFVDTGSFYGLPSCSFLKPLLLLYRETGKAAYLKAAESIVADFDRPGNPISNLVGNAFGDKPVHEWYSKPFFWAKAYEAMSCMEGLVEYYRVTGNCRVRDAVLRLHEKLVAHELNPLQGVGYFDHFAAAARRANAVTEPCDVIHWMRVNRELYLLTGESAYLDYMERAFYNAFLAGVYRGGKWGAHAVRSHGSRHRPAPSQVGMKLHQCCVDNMPRAFVDWAQTLVCRRADGAYDVNFYSDVVVKVPDGPTVSISGNYPVSSVVTARVETATGCRIRFRVPGWCAEMTVDGASVRGPAHEVAVPTGGRAFVLAFDMSPRIVSTHAEEQVGRSCDKDAADWLTNMFESAEETPEMKGRLRHSAGAYVMRGPLVLAKCLRAGETQENIFDVRTVNRRGAEAVLEPMPNGAVWGAWRMTLRTDGDRREYRVSDFASAADTDDPRNAFSIWF